MEFLKGPEKRNKPNVVASHYGKTSRVTSSNFALRLDATDVHAQYHIFRGNLHPGAVPAPAIAICENSVFMA